MRLRSKPWAENELSENPFLVQNPQAIQGKWEGVFGNKNPICLEIGCGKGSFIVKTAAANPCMNFIAMERARKIIAMALKNHREEEGSHNLRFVLGDANFLRESFAPREISRVYINFCDPWRSRGKWRKRRLTHRNYLDIYRELMGGGEIIFKTDNRELFDFSLIEFKESGWELLEISRDLANSTLANITTEYEERFTERGVPICMAHVKARDR